MAEVNQRQNNPPVVAFTVSPFCQVSRPERETKSTQMPGSIDGKA
jgi:hypothetical protein